MNKRNMRIIGLTGGIATGKSSVARFFEEQGAAVIDADALSRQAVKPGSSALGEIVALFGSEMLHPDGSLNRKRLAGVVFADPAKRRKLEALLHPEIRRLADHAIKAAEQAGFRLLFYMAPLLYETGTSENFDEIWVVTVHPSIQVARLIERDGISRDEARRIIASQMPLDEKERRASHVIDNSGTPQETRHYLIDLWNKEIGTTP